MTCFAASFVMLALAAFVMVINPCSYLTMSLTAAVLSMPRSRLEAAGACADRAQRVTRS